MLCSLLAETTALEFRASYQSTIAAVTGRITGTPAGKWVFTISNPDGTPVPEPDISDSDNSTRAANTTEAVGNSTLADTTTAELNSTTSGNDSSTNSGNSTEQLTSAPESSSSFSAGVTTMTGTVSQDSPESAPPSSSSSDSVPASSRSLDAGSSSSSSGSRRRRLQHKLLFDIGPPGSEPLVHVGRSLQQQAPQRQANTRGSIRVSLSILAANPQLVFFRLTQPSSLAAAASAAALRNSCQTEYCLRLVAAGIPIESAVISIQPDFTAVINSMKASLDSQDAFRRQQATGGIIGGVVGGILLLIGMGITAWKISRKHRMKAALSAKEKADQEEPTGFHLGRPDLSLLQTGFTRSETPQDKATTDQLSAVAAALRSYSREQSETPMSVSARGGLGPFPRGDVETASQGYDHLQAGGYSLPIGNLWFPWYPMDIGNLRSNYGEGGEGASAAGGEGELNAMPNGIPEASRARNMGPPSGYTSPTPFSTVLSRYGTPGASRTPEMGPQFDQMAVDPDQLQSALAQYFASVIHMQQLLVDPSMWVSPKASPMQTPPPGSPGVAVSRSHSQSALGNTQAATSSNANGRPPRPGSRSRSPLDRRR